MRLEQVEITGFKSFCDRQELSFKGGVTGIVGPNGCGKSNISDAISWVLGEQSAKSLRGASMEDVIFGGSQSRQPLGMAEVNLKVSGLNGNSPDGNPECVVTRRLYRNGESEYLMNGQVCRLRDIHELFMDTGLGSKAYSIIEQGKIGQILSGKPADRRALIEEAAGITKYRARRRQTQLKLEAAQQNLLRVNDIVHEVEKQLESLKRQASRARRYRAVRDEMQGLERILFGRRFVDLRLQAESLALRIGAEGEREQSATIALESEEAQMEVRRTVLHEDEALLQDVRTRLNELTLAVDRHQGRSGYCKEQIAETEARAAEARGEAGELEARVGPLGEHLAARQAEESRLRGELATAGEEARASEAAVHEIAAAQARAEAELESAREAQLTVISRMSALQNARESVSGNAERAAADLMKLAAETEELERENLRVAGLRDGAQRRQEEADALVGAPVRAARGGPRPGGRGAPGRRDAGTGGRHRAERARQPRRAAVVARGDRRHARRVRRRRPGPPGRSQRDRGPGRGGGRGGDRFAVRARGGGAVRGPPAGGDGARRVPRLARDRVAGGVGGRPRHVPAPGVGADAPRVRHAARRRAGGARRARADRRPVPRERAARGRDPRVAPRRAGRGDPRAGARDRGAGGALSPA